MEATSPARKAAFAILIAVERGHGHSDDLLRGKSVTALSAPDRHLATALVLGVLRWQIDLDQQLQAFLKRPNAKLDAEILIALRLGAFQILHLDRIPARAAIDESVELAKQAGHRFASGMVNAVLRKLAASVQSLRNAAGDDKSSAPMPSLSHPAWLVDRWTAAFGAETASAICRYDQTQPTLAIRMNDLATESELNDAGTVLAPGALLNEARIVLSGDISAAAAFLDGRVRIQDEGSQLVAEIAGQGSAILDCCAAPGGKTLILAERNPRAHIVACESSARRHEQLRQRLALLGDRVECRCIDVTSLDPSEAFDLVLADVPCSGTGTLGRNPEIRHRLRLEDLPRQAERQRAILDAALRAVRPGGRVVYSTCSLEREENEEVIAAALEAQPTLRVVPMSDRIAEMTEQKILTAAGADSLQQCVTVEGYLRLFPGTFHTDGFFVALLEKLR
jgi:16S rRNA (cytosine967-C5)-methyltransferase